MKEKEQELLSLIEKEGRMESHHLAKMLDTTIDDVEDMLRSLEEQKIILGYSALIDWTKTDIQENVTAMIDVKVTPKRGVGFDAVAERIYRFKEVKALYLMSGTYDLSVAIEGKSMSEVAQFVSEKLSTLDSVISTTTHFQLKKYKHDGVIFTEDDDDDHRMVVSP
ncbi:Lrp/AsnC family transcriptional regulator [Salipaludibacillus agaradhaerens]|jgi:DNA-binding Lrp family transcriptional regulator|uniref:Lrp/AsnC family transcriptional regulator n=1 Tax=Salipaludibacillus agaradhaerens TaxID=76935 RepID=UPI0009984164|nr:Lrp/AsnC family transcriptional regulator [Salipaludibacillus agaradhaerens]MCR6107800.1 Lrp/AsnC family transcriptional regulator [Salipaludibacillus agaradhaerens]MCR6111922.1 Lrp/AsnC family transcriptional regulator [Bacillus sp. A301a_S52]MCR6119829.1 Lrp/AsnC family transcriptional regulator [Salipaludibacillus agaradhaerens]UJW58881.1 Lrp/AsnC family transcriptional regulator [Bacillus sp. A116_S68]